MSTFLRFVLVTLLVLSTLAGAFLWGFVVGRAQETAALRLILDQPDPCWEARPPDPAPLTLTPVLWCATLDESPRAHP
jgi:hypothetical protein